MLLPRRVPHRARLVRPHVRQTWRLFAALARGLPEGGQREGLLKLYDPLAIALLFFIWFLGLILAFSLLEWALHPGGTDARLATEDDVWASAEKRHDEDGTAPRTISRNDLVVVASVPQFATTRGGGRLLVVNSARGVTLDLPSQLQTRDKTFHHHEVRDILRLMHAATDDRHSRAAASRRWAPWICAYSGARIQEV